MGATKVSIPGLRYPLIYDAGQAIEVLGFVNPIAGSGETVRIDADKAKAWIAKGASPSKTVLDLFKKHAIL